jgi:hypothetical protein
MINYGNTATFIRSFSLLNEDVRQPTISGISSRKQRTRIEAEIVWGEMSII